MVLKVAVHVLLIDFSTKPWADELKVWILPSLFLALHMQNGLLVGFLAKYHDHVSIKGVRWYGFIDFWDAFKRYAL